MKLVRQNDESLLRVVDELKHAKNAKLVVLDNVQSDFNSLRTEIEPIRETVKAQAEKLEEAGQIVQMSVKELSEQRTSIRSIDRVPQYNKIDHHTGRTPMERFIISAETKIVNALELTERVKDKFVNLLEFFGEDEGMPSSEFFGTLTRFLMEFGKSIERVVSYSCPVFFFRMQISTYALYVCHFTPAT